jgi:O-antigen ligase
MARVKNASPVVDVLGQARIERHRWQMLVVASLLFTLVIGAIAHVTAPQPWTVVLVMLVFSCVATFIRPEVGMYIIVFFSLIGDNRTVIWWPFTKNLSMRESIFFVHDALPMTPLDFVLGVAWASFLMRSLVDRTWRFRRGRLLPPLLVLGAFVFFGIVRGVGSGGASNIALLEFRPLVYLIALYALIPNVLVTRTQYRITFALALVAVTIQSLLTLGYYQTLSSTARELLEELSEHTATVAMNVVFLFLLALIAFGGTRWKRWAVAGLLPPVVYAFLLSQRRAAMIALFAGLVVLAAVLFFRRRRRFWKVVPVLGVLGVLYVLATWRAKGAVGLPANAVKTVLFPGQLDASDQNSNIYRDIENYNLWFTIRSNPLLGVGFGRRFYVVRSMPDISFFEYWQYLSHNSVLWVWVKMGAFGFLTFLFMIGRAIQRGARSALRVGTSDDAAIVVAALGYVIMFVVFAYVDIIWDIRPAVVLSLCLAICADFVSTPDPAAPPRPRMSSAGLDRAELVALGRRAGAAA